MAQEARLVLEALSPWGCGNYVQKQPLSTPAPRVWNSESRKALAPSSKPLKFMIVIKIFVFNTGGCVCVCVSQASCVNTCVCG